MIPSNYSRYFVEINIPSVDICLFFKVILKTFYDMLGICCDVIWGKYVIFHLIAVYLDLKKAIWDKIWLIFW